MVYPIPFFWRHDINTFLRQHQKQNCVFCYLHLFWQRISTSAHQFCPVDPKSFSNNQIFHQWVWIAKISKSSAEEKSCLHLKPLQIYSEYTKRLFQTLILKLFPHRKPFCHPSAPSPQHHPSTSSLSKTRIRHCSAVMYTIVSWMIGLVSPQYAFTSRCLYMTINFSINLYQVLSISSPPPPLPLSLRNVSSVPGLVILEFWDVISEVSWFSVLRVLKFDGF